MQNRLRPLARAWGASGVAVALAVLTHVLAGGHTPNPILVTVAWALGAVAALPFTTRRPSTTRLAGLLLPAQLIYHLAFGRHVMSHHTGAHLHGAELEAALGTSAPGGGGLASGALSSMADHAAGTGALMVVAHVLAALASVAAIRWAERGFDAARALAATLSDAVARLACAARLPRIPATRRRAWVPIDSTARILRDLALPRAVTRRGPPSFLAAHA
jgi:hypothetical protein